MSTNNGTTPQAYVALPGRTRPRFGLFSHQRWRLWLGADHVLHVRTEVYRENYKRFELRDIQGLALRKTRSGAVLNAFLATIAAVFGIAAVLTSVYLPSGVPAELRAVFFFACGGCAASSILGLLLNTAFGPTCVCHLVTAVQVEPLPSLGRVRSAQKAFGILRSHIESAQGGLDPAADPEAASAALTHPDRGGDLAMSARPPRRRALRPYSGWAHALLFGALFACGLSSAYIFHSMSVYAFAIGGIAALAVLVAVTVTLVVQADRFVTRQLQLMAWISLGYVCVAYAGVAMLLGGLFESLIPAVETGASQAALTMRTFRVSLYANLAVCSMLGIAGFAFLTQFRRQRAGGGPDGA